MSEGVDIRYGARHLKRAIEQFLVLPLASLAATGQARLGDVIMIELDQQSQQLTFFRAEAESARAMAALEAARSLKSNNDRIAA